MLTAVLKRGVPVPVEKRRLFECCKQNNIIYIEWQESMWYEAGLDY